MQIFQNLTTCCQTAWPQWPHVLQVSSSVTVHKSVSVHNFKNENFFLGVWISGGAGNHWFLPLLVSHLEVCCHCPGASHGVFVWIYPSTSAIALLDSWCCVWLPEPEGGREWRERWQPSKLMFFIVGFYFLSVLLNPRSSSSLTTQGIRTTNDLCETYFKIMQLAIKFIENFLGTSP